MCPPRHVRELANVLVEEWRNISQQELAILAQSMRISPPIFTHNKKFAGEKKQLKVRE